MNAPDVAAVGVENPGAKVLLVGGTGTGKTYSIRTLANAGLEVFVLFAENGMATLRDTDPERVHWHYVAPQMSDLNALITMTRNMNLLTQQQLQAMADPNKNKHVQLVRILETLSNFKDDRTGKAFGPVDSWGTDKVLVLDSLSGISISSLTLVAGDKPVKSPGEWGMAMDRVEKILMHLCFTVKCHVVVTSHEERELDEITGGILIFPSVPGKKLAPKVPRFFDDVLYCYRKDRSWLWSTNYPQVKDLKSRHLGIFDSAPQDFVPLIKANRAMQAAPAA